MSEAATERIVKDRSKLRVAAGSGLLLILAVAVWFQRDIVTGALRESRALPATAIVLLVLLALYERWSRADIVRRLLGDPIGIGTAVTVHDVGTAVSKGVPMGGALGTAMRWTIVRDSGVSAARFTTMLFAYGIATTFVSWLLPFAALLVDLTRRSADATDILILTAIALVVIASAVFWVLTLRSDRLEAWTGARLRAIWLRLAPRVPSLGAHDPAVGLAEVRTELHAIVRNPAVLLLRTAAAQACGSLILLVALRGVGVGDELGLTEFFRVFFLTHLLGTFAPTPGGVGVVEAGMTGALVAAGVGTEQALASVIVYRFLTYVLPIASGAALWAWWRVARKGDESARLASGPDPCDDGSRGPADVDASRVV
ncbi:MAG: lysylphosphatidylglycerol synthase transmembrane domain-containing protein [Ilumatobacter sp.]|uniref:lysylphosphatidylglycerol synthase transmembrane domain-containing protein n=1 Tax=Ilumatobacter sp. TaxID=1967498 RepID=UPI00329A3AE7